MTDHSISTPATFLICQKQEFVCFFILNVHLLFAKTGLKNIWLKQKLINLNIIKKRKTRVYVWISMLAKHIKEKH